MCKDNVQSNQINSWSYIWTLSLYQSRATNHHEYRRVEVVVPTYTKRKIWPLWSMVFTQFSGTFLLKKKKIVYTIWPLKKWSHWWVLVATAFTPIILFFLLSRTGLVPVKKPKKQKKGTGPCSRHWWV